ncbi:hypothetical protein KC338_g90 [Hortaea werneckii]|nr:hypothetical protein KC338_g90 [Hortaea werneckii]
MIVRIPVYIVLGLWSLAAGVSILGGSGVVKGRVALAVYPLFIFYIKNPNATYFAKVRSNNHLANYEEHGLRLRPSACHYTAFLRRIRRITWVHQWT